MRNSRLLLTAFVLTAAWLCGSASSAIVIDDFSQGPMQLTAFGGQSQMSLTQPNLNPDFVLGGQRNWSRFYHNAPPAPADSFTSITIDPTDGTFEFRSESDLCRSCGYFNLTYGRVEEPLNLDLLAEGADRFRFRFVGEGSPTMTLKVWAPATNGGAVIDVQTDVGVRNVIAPSDAIVEVPFDRFDFEGEPLVDLSQVERVSIDVFRFPAGQRFELDSIETAPAPLTADYDRDGDVDEADYALWEDASDLQRITFPDGELTPYRSRYPGLSTDGNGDGRTDLADYTIWRDAFTQAAAATPEPGAAALLMLALIGLRSRVAPDRR